MNTQERLVQEITPLVAQRYLEKNNANRPLSIRTIRELAQAMENGEWQVNGEAIKFDIDGNLIDGQHRLNAIIKSDRPIKTFVLRDLSADSFKTLDTGKKRNNADTLGILGFNNPLLLAAASRFVLNFRANQLRSHENISNIQMEDFVSKNAEIGVSIDFIKQVKADVLLPGSIAVGLHFLMRQCDREDAEIFITDLAKGSMLSASDPVFLLREKLLYYRNRVGAKMTRRETVAHVIKAWNLRRTGKVVKRLTWSKKTGEEFPIIR